MSNVPSTRNWKRRTFLKASAAGLSAVLFNPFRGLLRAATPPAGNPVFWVDEIPDMPYAFAARPNDHAGFETLLYLMAGDGLKFYRSNTKTILSGPIGLIAADDIVMIKVNAQWKYRGCTNSDLVRGLIQRILDHPDGYTGEVIIFENGQGRGSLACDTSSSYGKDKGVHANANDERQSFLYLVSDIFKDKRVSARLMDKVRTTFLTASDHVTNGFRKFEDVSYPCFTTDGGHRVELKEGVWTGSGYGQNLKLINVPVLKHHDTGGAEITASLKHFYGVVSMSDGSSSVRHYDQLGRTTGTMAAKVRTPVLNIIDAIWVSYASITGFPAGTTFRANQIAASQDPVALDAFSAKNIIYPIDKNERHNPSFPGIDAWLTQARDTINNRGGLYNPSVGVYVDRVTKDESQMRVFNDSAARFVAAGPILPLKQPKEPIRNISPGDGVPRRGNPSIIR